MSGLEWLPINFQVIYNGVLTIQSNILSSHLYPSDDAEENKRGGRVRDRRGGLPWQKWVGAQAGTGGTSMLCAPGHRFRGRDTWVGGRGERRQHHQT